MLTPHCSRGAGRPRQALASCPLGCRLPFTATGFLHGVKAVGQELSQGTCIPRTPWALVSAARASVSPKSSAGWWAAAGGQGGLLSTAFAHRQEMGTGGCWRCCGAGWALQGATSCDPASWGLAEEGAQPGAQWVAGSMETFGRGQGQRDALSHGWSQTGTAALESQEEAAGKGEHARYAAGNAPTRPTASGHSGPWARGQGPGDSGFLGWHSQTPSLRDALGVTPGLETLSGFQGQLGSKVNCPLQPARPECPVPADLPSNRMSLAPSLMSIPVPWPRLLRSACWAHPIPGPLHWPPPLPAVLSSSPSMSASLPSSHSLGLKSPLPSGPSWENSTPPPPSTTSLTPFILRHPLAQPLRPPDGAGGAGSRLLVLCLPGLPCLCDARCLVSAG